ncbi:MAG: glycosyltransferase [Chthoniobacterales bacterium]|nr:glycosyltransferase [Chthoniobacterales bacterium]
MFVNSEQYRRSWIDRGIEPEKLKILPRGLDTELFNPARRDEDFWERFRTSTPDGEQQTSAKKHCNGSGESLSEIDTRQTRATSARGLSASSAVRLLYVGRLSKEKDLDVLAAAYRQLLKGGCAVELYIVGSGPYAGAFAELVPDAFFTGYLAGEDLAAAYASADIFVFPSTTDTFGNVIIEAQASGLPVVVSNLGGPKELVQSGINGLITKAHDICDFAGAIRKLATEPELRRQMSVAARESVMDRSWPIAFRHFWAATAV